MHWLIYQYIIESSNQSVRAKVDRMDNDMYLSGGTLEL